MYIYVRLRYELCMSLLLRQRQGVKTSSFVSPFSLYCNVVVLVLCIRLFLSCLPLGLGCLSLLVSKSWLIGPGLPLPMDVAPPTTVQCIRPAAPRDCPRTSLSLFPRSSSLVRRQGRQRKKKTIYIQGEVKSDVYRVETK